MINLLKILFLDIDGTIRLNNKIDSRIIKSIADLNTLGVKVILNTGRNFLHARKLARKLAVYPIIIACNGSLIKRVDNNEIISLNAIPRTTVRKIFTFTKDHNCQLLAHEPTNNYYIRNNDSIGTNITGLTITSSNYDRMLALKYLFEDRIPEVTVANSSKAIYLETRLSGKVYFHDINVQGITKGYGIIKTLSYLGINPDEAMAIGDSNNDIAMSKVVKTSVATENATPKLKQISTIVLDEPLGAYLEKLIKIIKEKRENL